MALIHLYLPSLCKRIVILIFLLSTFFFLSEATAWTPLDTLKIKEVGKIAISSTEKQIAYEVLVPSVTEEKGSWLTEIYICLIDKLETKKMLLDGYVPNSIEWFPDGNSILFLSKVDGKTRINRSFIENNLTETLLEDSLNITSFSVSHKGDKIAFLALSKATPNKSFEIVDEFPPQSKLYLLNLTTQTVELLTGADYSVGAINWAPNDGSIVFDHQPSARVEDRVLYSKISTVNLSSREVIPIVENDFSNFNPQFSPDGKWIAYVSGPGTWEFTFYINVVNLDGKNIRLSSTPDEQVELIGWLSDNKSIVVAERYHTVQRLYRLSIDQTNVESLTPSESVILQPKISLKGNLIAYRSESPSQPPEVFISHLPFDPIQISHVQTTDYPKINTQVISWKSFDGKIIEGLLSLPTDNSTGPFPLLVLIRGHSSIYLNTYEGGIHLAKTPYSIGVFADQGYAVLRPFFRGSSGYGRLMRNSIRGDWGGQDFDDLLAGIDFLIEKGIVDSNRLGIMGWSYGGFMTANAITKTHRFKAASAGGALIDFVSYAGTTDIPQFLPYYMNGWFWNNPQTWKTYSPIEHVKGVKTPTLIQHSAGDKRVPPSQGFELYTALKYQHIPAKLILYSDSGHSLSNPKTIVEGIKHNLDWFNLWLKEKNILEIRAYVPDFEKAKEILMSLKAVPKGDYSFQDYIYQPKEGKYDLNQEFVRLRVYQKTNWGQKRVELTHKIKNQQGYTGENKLKKQFDSMSQAEDFLINYEIAFSYNRRGIEYNLGNSRIFLEEIEGLPPSIEVLSPSRESIDQLFDSLHPTKILSDSVPKLIEDINEKNL